MGSRLWPSGLTGSPVMPSMRGMEGPKMSASNRAVLRPICDSAMARLVAVVDLPTPPLPEATAMIALTWGSSGASACPAP